MAFRIRSRRTAGVLVGVALAAGLRDLALRDIGTVPVLRPGHAYAVEVHSEQTTVDLAFDHGTRFLLIVSSLARAETEHTIALSATPAEAIASVPVRALAPLDVPAGRIGNPSYVATGGPPVAPSRSKRQASRPPLRIGNPSPERDFYLHVAGGTLDDPRHYARVRSRVVAEGRHVRVYLDGRLRLSALAPGLVDDIVSRFDDEIIPLAARRLGTYRDVDGDGRFAVLLTSWLGRLEGGRTSLGGFVRGADFRRDAAPPFSNRCDMLYLNADLRPGPHLGALLAHEFAHAVCFSERTGEGPLGAACAAEEDWLNEAIAHVAENLYGASWSNLDYRISRYLAEPARYPLVVPDYYDAGLWRNHGCRGATFLFLRWCADQFGEDLLRRLVRGPLPGIRNLESATGLRFDELYRRWTVALACSDPSACGAYRSVDLYGTLPGWGLGGPRVERWEMDGDSRLLVVRGTATAFIELEASEPGIRSVSVQATPGAALQVSLLPIPADAPRLQLDVECDLAAESLRSRPAGVPRPSTLRLRAIGSSDDLQIDWAACEQHDGESRLSVCIPAEKLAPQVGAALLAGRNARPEGVDLGTFALKIPGNVAPDAELTVKVAARDRHGRRAVAWASVPLPRPREERPPRLASRTRGRPVSLSPSATQADETR